MFYKIPKRDQNRTVCRSEKSKENEKKKENKQYWKAYKRLRLKM